MIPSDWIIKWETLRYFASELVDLKSNISQIDVIYVF